jgi:integrase
MKVPKNISYPFIQQTKFGKVKIYKNGTEERPHFIVAWVSQESGRQRKLFRSREEAFTKMEELVDDFESGRISRKNVTTEKAMSIAECEEMLKPYQATLMDAVRFYVEHQTKAAAKMIKAEDAVAEYLKTFDDKKGRYYRSAKSSLEKFGRHFQKTMNAITASELTEYLGSISSNGKTKNNHRNYLQTFFTWAQEIGKYVPEGKLEISKIKPFPEKKSRPNLYSIEEVTKLLVCAEDRFLPYLAISAFAGVRSAEICRLSWEDIRIDQKVIRLGPEITKTQSGRLAEMPDNLIAWLQSYKGAKKGRVCPYVDDQIHKYTPEMAKAAGVKWRHNALRKGYISARMSDVNTSPAVVAENCGNSPEVIKSNYRGLVLPEYGKGWFDIRPMPLV